MLMLVVATIPTAVIGLGLEDLFTSLFHNPVAVAVAFAVTGTFLWLTRYADKGDIEAHNLTFGKAVAIGLAQGMAITPGISRSGSTIAAGMFLGMDRQAAARYSFLLAIPTILGAFVLKVGDLNFEGASVTPIVVGVVASAISGYAALRLLIHLVKAGDFSKFAYYLWPLAAITLLLNI